MTARRVGARLALAGAVMLGVGAFASAAPARSAALERQASALCAAAFPAVLRLDTDEHRALADAKAGRLGVRALFARLRTDLLAAAGIGRRVAGRIAALPGAHADALTARLVAGLDALAGVIAAEAGAVGRDDQAAIRADAARASRLIDANRRLVPACGLVA